MMKPTFARPILAFVAAAVLPAGGGCAAPGPRPQLAAPRPAPAAVASDPTEIVTALLAAHNAARERSGRPPLEPDARLEAAARAHARDMAEHHAMRHRGSDGSSPFARIRDQGYGFQAAAENVAAGQASVEQVMRGWMSSPGHRRNILGNYSQIGVACAIAMDGTPYWCATFGRP